MLFRVGLVLLKGSFMKSGVMKQCPTMFESMDVLRHLNQNITEERYLIGQVVKCFHLVPSWLWLLAEWFQLLFLLSYWSCKLAKKKWKGSIIRLWRRGKQTRVPNNVNKLFSIWNISKKNKWSMLCFSALRLIVDKSFVFQQNIVLVWVLAKIILCHICFVINKEEIIM